MTRRFTVVICIFLLAFTAFGYWRHQVLSRARTGARIAIIRDVSDSKPANCNDVLTLTERALATSAAGSDATITLFVTGDEKTANEPRFLGEFEAPRIRRVMEGKQLAARQRGELLAHMRSRCEAAGVTQVSPIFQAVKRGVEHMQTVGSPEDLRIVFVETDGEETVEAHIKRALSQATGTSSKLPQPIRNEGVSVVFCGMAETVGVVPSTGPKKRSLSKQRSPQRADRLQEVWSGLFTNPSLVRFEPFCSSNGAAGSTSPRS